ncbi:hypothetical protein F383_35487 [Gossypium arboreum]|uniref:Uncharacterized protein n=1 Tax=Gossypium arboreum TaxID=29729 RepID=A0A0B0N9B6_GOSAR|nr:hypothetical protein F383_35487 [Gossypium arboreum]
MSFVSLEFLMLNRDSISFITSWHKFIYTKFNLFHNNIITFKFS